VYILQDVIFDETVFSFTKLSSGTCPHPREEILLLLPSTPSSTPSAGKRMYSAPPTPVHILSVPTNAVLSHAPAAEIQSKSVEKFV
jgi:hypothetical protein